MALKRGRQIKGTAKPKGAKGQSYKKRDKNNKIKTKAKTANRNVDKITVSYIRYRNYA
jgi:hypothetical protein